MIRERESAKRSTFTMRVALASAWLLAIGIVLSGPAAMVLQAVTFPQPSWVDTATFVAHYHAVQTVPFYLGFLLVLGSILLVTSMYRLADDRARVVVLPGVVFVTVYASLISFNYVVQTTFVPALVARYPDDAGLLGALTMANPRSLAWALEMWGYAWLGLAMACLIPCLRDGRAGALIRWLLAVNAIVSVVGAFLTSADLGWVMTPAGLAAFFGWNLLFLVIVALVIADLRRRVRAAETVPG